VSPIPPNRRRMLVAAACGVLVCSIATTASADDAITAARKKREDARNAQLQAARQINLLTAADAEVAKALADIEAAVGAQTARVEDARRQLADAHAELVARETDLATADQRLQLATSEMQRVLVLRYVGETVDRPLVVFKADDATDALRKEAALDFVYGSQSDALSTYRAARAERDRAVGAAQGALGEAERLRGQLDTELAELQSRLASQVVARDELQKRLSTWRATQDQLERDEAELTSLIQKRQLEVLKVTDASATAASLKGFINPAKGKPTSGFGLRMHPIFRETRQHNGVDFDGATGDPAWAAKEGRTLYAGTMSGYGNVIILDHGNGVSTLYAHLSKILVSQGVAVKKGEVIGLIGSTGLSTGPHLHFEVRVGGTPKDPMLFLP
jgi:murein DD-endopeptidase MepM/ murein hydrolase activator NlpD